MNYFNPPKDTSPVRRNNAAAAITRSEWPRMRFGRLGGGFNRFESADRAFRPLGLSAVFGIFWGESRCTQLHRH